MAPDNDGVALNAMPHPLHIITEAMLQAGAEALGDALTAPMTRKVYDVVADTYAAMVRAAPPEPGELNEASLGAALIEIRLHQDMVEHFAERCALGNNGGTWAHHYTEEQKEHWRQFGRELAEEIFAARIFVRTEPPPCPPPETS